MDHRERLNAISHLIGTALALAGLVVLVVLASEQGDPWKIVSFSIYGVTLVIMYLFSTLYHSLSGRSKEIFRKADHAAIYLLIAGTYTPFTLVTLRGAWGWSLFGTIWGLALFGILIDVLIRHQKRVIPVLIYLFMGWSVLIAIRPLSHALPLPGMIWLVTGGIFYTAGILFYALDTRVRQGHGIFHFFVLGGSLSHYIAILIYVR